MFKMIYLISTCVRMHAGKCKRVPAHMPKPWSQAWALILAKMSAAKLFWNSQLSDKKFRLNIIDNEGHNPWHTRYQIDGWKPLFQAIWDKVFKTQLVLSSLHAVWVIWLLKRITLKFIQKKVFWSKNLFFKSWRKKRR